ncbi:peptidoglycan DD-metalloendopeptidase family protein [Clostridium sp. JS66]|uniref:peptidoglycan DD-metalloendopeptidase family protein n=1 Tax=Clostridium sp. JS66 TaxID=3064705 RepID=UPI00298E1BB9|nr:peptidoglycan DD-metalloendopeptidase family protein [Clostridium sp. JS66]WPC42100.1 peptidoglycan DD-metalloendopeptidase family protein [Clostridium sp. JS66]
MDKKFLNKVTNFFKKEGFYVILFVCLCIVATVAVLTAKSSKNANNALIQQQNTQAQDKAKKETAKGNNESSLNYDNALQVKKESKPQVVVPKSETKSQSVSNSVSTSLSKPVEGSLARAYSEDPVYWDSTSSYRPNLGLDIKTDLGKPVMAAMDGKVEEIDTATQDGVKIVINHQNGLKTVYSNLDQKVKVSKGQSVTKGTLIGTVGKTTLRSAYEKYGDHLHFEVLKGNDFVDPAKYVKY